MLKLFQDKMKCNFLLIQDDEHISGIPLLCSILKHLTSLNIKIHVCIFEYYQQIHNLPFFNKSHVEFHDFFSNPTGWDKKNDRSNPIDTDLSKFFSFLSSDSVVVIDSLNPLFRCFTSQKCMWMLQQLMSNDKISCVVSLFHLHLLNQSQYNSLLYISDSVLTLKSEYHKLLCHKFFKGKGNKDKLVCSLTHQKQNGKVLITDEEFIINTSTFDIFLKPWNPPATNEKSNDNSQTFDSSGLTFSLELTQSEDDQRKSLVMPYSKLQLDSKAGGQIIYEADESDLYEDDPDDDLDF